MVKIGVTVFPGSNCEKDVFNVLKLWFNVNVEYIWHLDKIKNYDAIIIPGGFTYGDRLRAGAIAAHSPLMDTIKDYSEKNIPILGICNGFQILVESGLLPGALIMNDTMKFECSWNKVQIVNNKTPFTNLYEKNQQFYMPIAHGEGRYVIDEKSLKNLKDKNQITIKYDQNNPNGSLENIAAITNSKGNVMGMMPHPERGVDPILVPKGLSNHCALFFKSLIHFIK